jgi:sulfatase maturation enzyme AslB (radical SAM superfamily)
MKNAPKNLCSLPWTGFSNEPDGRVQPCCLYKGYIEEDGKPMYVQTHSVDEIFHSKFMKDLRSQFRNNERPIGCSTCWTDEDNNYDSKRIVYNTKIHHTFGIDWAIEPVEISEFQLIISNSCNLKCRSCTPSHSSQWQQEMKQLTGSTGYDMPHGQSAEEAGKLWLDRHSWYKNLKRLEVVGGEPFYVKQWHTMFNELIDLGYSKNIDITLTTNCTLFFPELIDRIAENFKSVSIGLSIDGIGSTYEYMRHLGKWPVVYENMKKYHALTDKLNIQLNLTISWLNILEVPELHELVSTEFPKFKIWNNIVHYPQYLSVWAVPEDLKKAVMDKWDKYQWKTEYKDTVQGVLNYMNSKSITDDEFKNNLKIIHKTDNFRNESIVDSIPVLEKFLK